MNGKLQARLLCGAAVIGLMSAAGAAHAAEANFVIPPQSLASALSSFSEQSGRPVLYRPEIATAKVSPGATGEVDAEVALNQLLAGTGLSWKPDGDTFLIVKADQDPQSGSAAGDGAEGTVEALIVTAQKREEDIQDVPIAISAFTQEQLERSQVAGGPDLMTQIPNMTFTKTNFSSYSIQIRGIGTQAISATVDPAVAVAFNNTPFIRNRFFEQEFYDLQRVEVLRGPQGTLYGRNATAGVVNLISRKPTFGYEAKLSGDVANYNTTRLEGMLNVPLVEDLVALRLAGAWTKREGYSTNDVTGAPIDGRDLWSTRVSLRIAPTDHLDANLIWEHFEEDDDRIRSGKQLCKTDVVTNVAGFDTPDFFETINSFGQGEFVQSSFSQGCAPASLYADESFQKPNGLSLPYYVPLDAVGLPTALLDPYESREQSRDLRVIESTVDPSYRAKTDLVELQIAYDLTDTLTVNSETAWSSDFVFSTQDFNRFNTARGAWSATQGGAPALLARNILRINADGNAEYCDPQIGCADRLVAVDLSTAKSTQFSQEFRIASNFDSAFNFSLGANYLRHDTQDKYYVFINSIGMMSALSGNPDIPYDASTTDNRDCLPFGMAEPNPFGAQPVLKCTYIDPNPIGSLNDLGHNYFLSKNPYKLISYAVFGESYYNITDNLKLTAGLRWTVDKKQAPLIPSWLFASWTVGYPVQEVVNQEWREPTGRLTLDWKPDLAFTDETMVYASYGHGYKAGGMNPPPYGKAFYGGEAPEFSELILKGSATAPKTFDPEFVDAFELGAKNTLRDGGLTLNVAAFYYDYKGYQLSQIVNRSAVTLNYDAEVWGIEVESDWRPMENLKLGLKLGYENTRVADGMKAIDVMDRVAGMPGWVLSRPFPSTPSNCVLPAWLFVGNDERNPTPGIQLVDVGGKSGGNPGGCEIAYVLDQDPATWDDFMYDPYAPSGPPKTGEYFRTDIDYPAWSTELADYPCWPGGPIAVRNYPGVDPACLAALSNNGEGFFKDLSGNELPNAPDFTATITADYTVPLPQDWLMTLHTDLYMQSEAWTRIFNTEGYDKLKAYTNVNLAAIFTNEELGWKVMAYVKNVFDRDSITGAFLGSDDSGLTTNVFLTEPRLYGLRVTKDFSGGPWWTAANPDHKGPFPLTVELGGQVQRHDAPYETMTAPWVDGLPANLVPENVQNRDLDWGDGRSLKLTWRPDGSPWSVSAGVRYGRTNSDVSRTSENSKEVIHACKFTDADFRAPYFCDPNHYYGRYYYARYTNVEVTSWSDAEARNREEHLMIDFGVGMDVGLGVEGLESSVGAGVRYAEFESLSTWGAGAQAGWDVPVGWGYSAFAKYYVPSSVTRYRSRLSAEREFSGAGPVLTWAAALPLLGNDETGKLKLDWSVTGGALFGDRETQVLGAHVTQLHQGELIPDATDEFRAYYRGTLPTLGDPDVTPVDITRSDNATVPLVDLSLGLSYDVGRIKVGAGYRWERYFDVLDAGYEEAEEADRTIDGPYFKLAIGFGG